MRATIESIKKTPRFCFCIDRKNSDGQHNFSVWKFIETTKQHTELSESSSSKSNWDCNYAFPIDLAPIGIPIAAISIMYNYSLKLINFRELIQCFEIRIRRFEKYICFHCYKICRVIMHLFIYICIYSNGDIFTGILIIKTFLVKFTVHF